ncbi:MAG TPA: DNA polymerase III subunit delta [Burkholderiales bacterium]|nr:DNA polymerase III subunit delta [Burkholderiales bacterium]
MPLRAEQLAAQLARALAPVYTIHGDEPLLALEAADAVRAAARKAGYTEREVFFAERGFDWAELRHAGASRSLFGGRKILELRVPSGKPGTQGAEAIAALCADPNPEQLLLVSLPRLDRAGQNSVWFAALSAAGVLVDVFPVERARLPAWIGERLARQGQRAGREVLEFLADRVEGNLLAAFQEVQKLALLAPPGELALEEVRAAVANVARYDASDASAALLAGDMSRYARVIDGLRGEGEAPSYVLWAIAEDLRALARIRQGLAAGRPLDALMRENRVWGPRQALVRGALNRYAPAALERSLVQAAAVDRAIKGAARREPWDEFLKLGLKLTHGSEA